MDSQTRTKILHDLHLVAALFDSIDQALTRLIGQAQEPAPVTKGVE